MNRTMAIPVLAVALIAATMMDLRIGTLFEDPEHVLSSRAEGEPCFPTFTYPFCGNVTDQQVADLRAACHKTRNLAGAWLSGAAFADNDDLPGGCKASPIPSEDRKTHGWTVENLAFALRTGIMPDGDTFGRIMGEVVQGGTAFLGEEDLTAVAEYVLDYD